MEKDKLSFKPEDRVPKAEIPANVNKQLWDKVPLYQLIYSIAGLLIGYFCILGGILLMMNGILGTTNWTAKILGSESTLTDATPGVILFIVGFFIVFITKFSIKVKKSDK